MMYKHCVKQSLFNSGVYVARRMSVFKMVEYNGVATDIANLS